MFKRFILLGTKLNLFDGAATGGEGGGDSGATGETQASPVSTRRGKSGEYTNVKFGKQDTQAMAGATDTNGQGAADAGQKQGVTTTSNTLEERRKAYQSLINGEYKDLYTEDTQRIINRRFKETQSLQQQVGQYQPVIDMLMQRFNIGDGDISKLTAAIENDDAFWAEAAEAANMSVEQFRAFQQVKRENAEMAKQLKARQGMDAANRQMQQWAMEAQQVKSVYPSFDLNAEMENAQFSSLLRAKVPMQHAYEVVHMEDIKAGVAQMTAKATEKKVADSVRAKGARPAENGTAAQSAFTIKEDPSKWNKKDRAEVFRRVARGETITL